ncbi:hypothetical protein N7448_007825 [Penicillium atrosanguineum]|uniref:C2H2-type domain-containing protein n=1 Tax=Penicillium atrosanguineum TaxID=1132637 RepID=A0A9W9GQD3_9EURO|nr:uncharacterized protein N7443_001154 [Penicillium atrosanguineum]KAJ5127046.1 hypothetical protein N7448_007825 [Penicillium atrosanguineum]KAJ5314270.1 hypothetical protein N7443_001154 [Penicillium atrosanguineum]KAJ5331437.1 hypothetical protein N7476_001220 [Penicillium atrosanguineum]
MPDSSQTPAATALLNLDHEIKTASEERLRALLLSICNEIPEAHKKAVKELFVDSSIVKNVPGQIAGTKRPVSRYERCGNCKEEFDVTENSKTSCRYHPGYAFPDEELFADHDEPLEILDSDDYRKSYPENFIFDCCDGNLMDDIGCEVDWHRSLETADISKRTRLDMLKEYDDQSSSEYESE